MVYTVTHRFRALLRLVRQQFGVDEGHDTTLRDNDVTKELVQLLVVPDGELKVARYDTLLLVITGGVTGEFENFSSQILKDCCEVD